MLQDGGACAALGRTGNLGGVVGKGWIIDDDIVHVSTCETEEGAALGGAVASAAVAAELVCTMSDGSDDGIVGQLI